MADFLEQFAKAKVECAKLALASPGCTPEGAELTDARQSFAAAKARLELAQARWDALIAPARGWAADPLKEQL